jgi:hypothetical protein
VRGGKASDRHGPRRSSERTMWSMRHSCFNIAARQMRRRTSRLVSPYRQQLQPTMRSFLPLMKWRSTAATCRRSRASIISNASFSSDSLSLVDQPKLFYTPTQKEVMDACQQLHSSIMPLNDKVRLMRSAVRLCGRQDGSCVPKVRSISSRSCALASLYSLVSAFLHRFGDRWHRSPTGERPCRSCCWWATTRRASRASSTTYWDGKFRPPASPPPMTVRESEGNTRKTATLRNENVLLTPQHGSSSSH